MPRFESSQLQSSSGLVQPGALRDYAQQWESLDPAMYLITPNKHSFQTEQTQFSNRASQSTKCSIQDAVQTCLVLIR